MVAGMAGVGSTVAGMAGGGSMVAGMVGVGSTAPAVDRWAILVNHHPSKYGGSSSAWRREAAVDRLRELCDSLRAAGWSRIVATGDFNDTADAPLFRRLDALENLALPLAARGQGTIRFNGRWELIDLFFLSAAASPACASSGARMTILHPPFLTERDKTHSGEKPRRTYIGPRYNGGVSDHRPIHLRLCYPSLAAPCRSLPLPCRSLPLPCHSLPLPPLRWTRSTFMCWTRSTASAPERPAGHSCWTRSTR